jgi:hypothetical protein
MSPRRAAAPASKTIDDVVLKIKGVIGFPSRRFRSGFRAVF